MLSSPLSFPHPHVAGRSRVGVMREFFGRSAGRAAHVETAGYHARDYVIRPAAAIPPNQIHEVSLSVAAPAYLVQIAVWSEQPAGFEVSIIDSISGDLASSPIRSTLLGRTSGTQQLPLRLASPRLLTDGSVTVRLRNLAAVNANFEAVLMVSEPLDDRAMQQERIMLEAALSRLVFRSSDGSAEALASGSSVSSTPTSSTVEIDPSPFSYNAAGDSIIIAPQSGRIQVWSLELYCADPSHVQLFAGVAGGPKTALTGLYEDFTGTIHRAFGDRPHFIIPAGQGLVVNHSAAPRAGGSVQYRVVS